MSDNQVLNPNVETATRGCPDPKAAMEALLFVSEKPLAIEQIKSALKDYPADKLKEVLRELKSDYDNSSRGLRLEEVAGGFQLVTAQETAGVLKEFFKQRDAQKLSMPALETLAIVAYKQPVTRLDIESLRGVNVDGVVKSLLEKNLIRIAGKKDIPGKPFVYGTTRQFLEYFGLNSVDDLPKVEEFTKNSTPAATLLTLSNRSPEFISGELKSEANEPAES